MSSLPFVSLLIPTYNRALDLEIALEHVARLTYPELEIVVIDDASTTSDIELIASRYQRVRYERLTINHGLIGARNAGLRLCRGKYVLNLDDDSWLVDPNSVGEVVRIMEANDSIAILALNIQTKLGLTWPTNLSHFVVPFYTGCGNVYRRNAVLETGECVREFVRQGEEMDRTIRVMNSDLDVVAFPGVVVFHAESPENRNKKRHQTFESINYFRRELIRAPWIFIPYGLARAGLFTLLRMSQIDWGLMQSELLLGERNWLRMLRQFRSPVRPRTYIRWHKLAFYYANNRRGDCTDYARVNRFAAV